LPEACTRALDDEDLAALVDPLIGSAGSGNVIPGPSLPHGMVKLSPDTVEGLGTVDAYDYGSSRIEGFSHTHLEGPGGSGYGYSEILLLPVSASAPADVLDRTCAFSHEDEEASVGYYRVALPDCGALAELAVTAHTGMHRYTFDPGQTAFVLLDVGHTRGRSRDGQILVVDDHTVEGHGRYFMHPLIQVGGALLEEPEISDRTVYFHAEFSAPFGSIAAWNKKGPLGEGAAMEGEDLRAVLSFPGGPAGLLEVRVGISLISAEQARSHVEAESATRSFDEVREDSRAAWNTLLNRVRVSGGTPVERVKFYTALYHSLLQPSDYTEDGRFWIGASGQGKVLTADGFRYHSDDFCMWDTFRTSHPLQLLVEPERVEDKVRSYLAMYDEEGWLPKCPWQAIGDNRIMIGNHVVCMIADAYAKGFTGFDTDKAWEAMHHNSMEDWYPEEAFGAIGYVSLGTMPSYIKKGYVPQEEDALQSASLTLEYAYDDWCMSGMASALGKAGDADYFGKRALNYQEHWDTETGFMRPKMKSGAWLDPFDPDAMAVGFCEADSWIYTWFVPHDPSGLVALMGGPEPFAAKLDEYFDGGHNDPSNEPAFHTPYLYLWAQRPDRAQERVRGLASAAFSAAPDGLPGNDDAGAMSAWLVFTDMGIYPVAPGAAWYALGSPAFSEVIVRPGNDEGCFVIRAPGASETAIYVAGARLDGQEIQRSWITHDELLGSVLELDMSASPSTFAAGAGQAPPSLSTAPVR
jgi:predicted alpha-1,2-mannosidase